MGQLLTLLTSESSPPAVQPEHVHVWQPAQPVQPVQQPRPRATTVPPKKRKRQLESQKWQRHDYNVEQRKKWIDARAVEQRQRTGQPGDQAAEKRQRTGQPGNQAAEKRQRTGQPGGQAAQQPLRQPPAAAPPPPPASGNVRTLADLQRAGPSQPPASPAAGPRIFGLSDLPSSGGACARCHSADGQLYEALGKVWHHGCLLCDRCQQPTGSNLFQIPGWDEAVYCSSCCDRRRDRCIACKRPSNGSWQLEEGRCVCSDCAATAIWTTDKAQPEYARVQRFFSQLGLALPAGAPPLELVDWSVLQQRAQQIGRQLQDVTHSLGLCTSVLSTKRVNGRVVSQEVRCTGIFALYGMPALLTGATIAHECTHAMMRMSGLQCFELNDFVEEGLAQLIALLYLEHRRTKGLGTSHEQRLCAAQLESIRQNSSQIYGDGFRAAYAAYQRLRSLQQLVQYVQRKHCFPS